MLYISKYATAIFLAYVSTNTSRLSYSFDETDTIATIEQQKPQTRLTTENLYHFLMAVTT